MRNLARTLAVLSLMVAASCQKSSAYFKYFPFPEEASVSSNDWEFVAMVKIIERGPILFFDDDTRTLKIVIEDADHTIIVDQSVDFENEINADMIGRWISDDGLHFVIEVEIETTPSPNKVRYEFQIE